MTQQYSLGEHFGLYMFDSLNVTSGVLSLSLHLSSNIDGILLGLYQNRDNY
jgi:hypothetical protein